MEARDRGILLHQRFDFSLPFWNEPRKPVSLADYRGKTVAVLLVQKHEDEASIVAATALQSIQDELGARGFQAVTLHLEPLSRADVLYYRIEDDTVEVVRILRERADAARHLRP